MCVRRLELAWAAYTDWLGPTRLCMAVSPCHCHVTLTLQAHMLSRLRAVNIVVC